MKIHNSVRNVRELVLTLPCNRAEGRQFKYRISNAEQYECFNTLIVR